MEFVKKYRDMAHKFLDKVLWTDETKINHYQSDRKAYGWKNKGTAHDPKHTSSSVKQGGGIFMVPLVM